MRFRFLGGWFVFVTCLVIITMIGCEKGSLGVRPATVIGRIVRDDNSVGIPGATVRLVSKEAVGSGEITMGANFMITTTDDEGNFIFEGVTPDNVLIEFQKGMIKGVYPSSEAGGTDEDTGVESESAEIEAVYVKTGVMLNIGDIPLKQGQNILPSKVNLKLELFNSMTHEAITSGRFVVTINGSPISTTSLTPDSLTRGIEIDAEQEFKIMIRHDPGAGKLLYKTNSETIIEVNGSEIYERINIVPVSYNLELRCTNVPDYIKVAKSKINIYAERIGSANEPPQILATCTVDIVEEDGNNSVLPGSIQVSALSMPINLRIQILGYEDEILTINEESFTEGIQGVYRIDINFLGSAPNQTYHPITASQAMIFDNMKRRDVVLSIVGPDLLSGDAVSAMINLPYLNLKYNPAGSGGFGTFLPGIGRVHATFEGVSVNYRLYPSVSVYTTSASGSYNIPSHEDGHMVSPEISDSATTLVIPIDAKRSEDN